LSRKKGPRKASKRNSALRCSAALQQLARGEVQNSKMPKPHAFFIAAVMIAASLAPVMAAQHSSVVASGTTPKKIQGELDTTEGPAVDADGNVYFTDKGSETRRIHDHRQTDGYRLHRPEKR
jgi:hypothetical protein